MLKQSPFFLVSVFNEITCFINTRIYNNTKHCTQKKKSNLVKYSPLALVLLLLSGQAFAYPDAKITNNTAYPISGKIEYVSALCKDRNYSVAPGKTHVDRDGRSGLKTGCLIGKITGKVSGAAKFGENTNVVTYDPDIGTSYGQFIINAFGDRYRIFSEAEFAKVSRTKQGKSPGFRFVNKTQWPVVYSLEQVGCLYHDVLPAKFNGKDGERTFNTGAVWFTLRAHIQPDGVNPQGDWDCIKPVAEIVGDVLIATASAAATVATGGAAAPATGAVLAKIVAKQAVKTAVKVSVKTISKKMVKKVGQYLSEAGTVTMAGQYAGYEWPFRCDKMPEYHITGGPGYVKDEDHNFYLTPGTPFTVKKVNGCGNKMMAASPKSATAKPSLPFPKIDSQPVKPTTTTTPVTNLEKACFDAIQGKVAWSQSGNKKWGPANIQKLCKGTKNPQSTINCFKNAIATHNDWNKGIASCVGNASAPVPAKSVNGRTVKQVNFNGGAFIDRGQKRWAETGANNQTRFSFTEVNRDDWSVYLKDSSRNVSIQLDLWTKKIMYGVGNSKKTPLYNISGSK